eukprot:6172459-Pleurochrysis_carterae.AAC.7
MRRRRSRVQVYRLLDAHGGGHVDEQAARTAAVAIARVASACVRGKESRRKETKTTIQYTDEKGDLSDKWLQNSRLLVKSARAYNTSPCEYAEQ